MTAKFKEGDSPVHKSNQCLRIVILKVLPIRFYRKVQKYKVRWYDKHFHDGIAFECELLNK